jgi:competence protein ComEC
MGAFFSGFFYSLQKCWSQAPALLYGLAFLLGCLSALHWTPLLLLPVLLIFSPLILKSSYRKPEAPLRLMLAAAIILMAFTYIKTTIHFPDMHENSLRGIAIFDTQNLSIIKKHHGKYATYKGSIAAFYIDNQQMAKNIPASIVLSEQLSLPPADKSYQITGTLKEISTHSYALIPDKEVPWIPIANTWSFAQLRFRMKQAVSAYIHNNIANQRSADFLSGIATGDFEDRMIAQELGRIGLQHIMAISGFHFAILASMLGFLLRLAFPQRISSIALIFLMTGYFIFLGCGPSILRAWLTSLIVLASFLIERKANALNTLGVALLVILGLDPLFCENIGFQFSFVCTAAILLLYAPCDDLLLKMFPMRPLNITSKMSYVSQHAYCFLYSCRSACALGLAINLVALPITLYYFQKFPWLGLVYNLFFPFMVSISMLLLMFGIILSPLLPPLALVIHHLNSIYTNFMLNYAYNIPINFDLLLRSDSFPIEAIIIQLSLLLTAGIYYKYHYSNKAEEWTFV